MERIRPFGRGRHLDLFPASGIVVFTLSGDAISATARFDNGVLARFGLPRTLP